MARIRHLSAPSITRRRFLQAAGALSVALAAQSVPRPVRAEIATVESPPRMGLLTDLTLCVGCRVCEVACNKANKLPRPEVPFSDSTVFEKERRPSAGVFTVVNRYPSPDGGRPVFRKVQCMHCNEPACVSACPVAAMVKTPEGPVIWDERVCIGCRYCMMACPFSIPAYEYSSAFSPRVRKCTMCYERVFKQGGIPACAEACPTKAIVYGQRAELLRLARRRIIETPEKYVDHIFGEKEVGGTSWLYLSAVPFENLGFPQTLDVAYGELTWDFLTAVPVVLILWPALMIGLHRFGLRREQLAAEEALKRAAQERKEERR